MSIPGLRSVPSDSETEALRDNRTLALQTDLGNVYRESQNMDSSDCDNPRGLFLKQYKISHAKITTAIDTINTTFLLLTEMVTDRLCENRSRWPIR